MALIAELRFVSAAEELRSKTWPPVLALLQENPVVIVVFSMFENVTDRVSPELAPTWKDTVPFEPAEPLSRLMPLKFDDDCWRSISCVSWLTSSWMSCLSVEEFVPLLYCTPSS